MATSELSAWDGCYTSQLKIVLLGGRNSGKSCVGNLLLGKEEFATKERTTCSRRLGMVAGRWVTVVDTPGWWCDFSAQDTTELVKREIMSSVSLCSPGPHVFLITIKASSGFTETRRRAVEEHVALLGERVWGHCLVVFTCTHRTEHSGEAEALHWLGERCSHRSVNLSGDTDVSELLEEIQKLVRENGNREFEMQEDILQATAEEKRRVEDRAQRRLMRVKEHRAVMQKRLRPVTDIRIVLVGANGSGKTSALNTILGRERSRPHRRTAQCAVDKGVVFGRDVTLVDTPGWWMNYFCNESTVFDLRELVLSLSLCPPGPQVFLLVVRVDRAFTETYRRAAQEHLQLISERVWSRVVVLLTFGDWLGGTTAEHYIESEGEPLRWLVERCGNRYHVLNNKTKGDGFQVRELIGKIELMMFAEGEQYYEIERSVMERMEVRMREENERAQERLMKKEKHRQMARSQLGKPNPLPGMKMVLVGGRKTGKSSCGNTILGRECFETDTQSTSCAENRGEIAGKTVTVLDTPGGFSVTSDLLVAPSSCAILLVANVSRSFTVAHREDLEKQLEAGGGQVWSRALVLFSHGDWLGDTGIERRIESEGEPLRGLVEKCGNRYHVLNNKDLGDGAQVGELMELMEETLDGQRREALHRSDHTRLSVSAACEQEPHTATLSENDPKVSRDSTESATLPTPDNHSEGTDAGGQIVAAPAGGTGGQTGSSVPGRDRLVSVLVSMLCGKNGLRWTAAGRQRLTPALRERTLRRHTEAGGLRLLIDQWGDSSLEELEAFIDGYFEMVWEQTMGSFQPTGPAPPAAEQDAGVGEVGEEEVLSSIDRKLSKLKLLEEIRSDLTQLRGSLEHSWRVIRELRDKHEQHSSN